MKKKGFLFLAVITALLCLFAISVSAEEHILDEAYTYENGFTSNGTYTAVCSCGSAECAKNEEREPLFVISGFSVPDDSSTFKGISYGYKANVELIEEYERVNNSKLSYGILLSSAKNYRDNPDSVFVQEVDEHLGGIDIRINYDEIDANGNTQYDKYDVIFADSVTETKGGNSYTSYFQSNLPTNLYSNEKYGALFGINYDVIAKKQNDLMVWHNNKGMNDNDGTIQDNVSSNIVSETYVKVKLGDTIIVPTSENIAFMLYGYNYVDGSYKYCGYIDCNRELGAGEENENWSTKYTFMEGDVTCVNGQENNTQEIDYNDFYVRIVFKSLDNTSLSYADFSEDIVFNIVEEPREFVTVTFKNGDNVTTQECAVGEKIGKLPTLEMENCVFLGWHEEGSSELYTSDTIVQDDVTLVPSFREYFTDIADYIVWSQSKINDGTGALLTTDASRYSISSFIKVNEGDSIVLPKEYGHRFVIYCYSDPYGTYVANSIIDCNSDDKTSSVEDWGYSYTFKNGDVLLNGTELNCDNLYIRIVFRKDDGGKNGSTDIGTIKNNIVFNITADNYHLVLNGFEGQIECNHQYGDWQVLQERTCYVDGSDVRECELCGKREVRYTQSTGHNVVIDEAVLGNCLQDGYTEGSHCSVCNTVITAQKVISKDSLHRYAQLVTLITAPTTTSTGSGVFKCVVCGSTRTETIDKIITSILGKDDIASITSNEYNPALDNVWKVVDGNKVSAGLYAAGDDWFGNVGDTLVITLNQEVTLNELKLYSVGNYTFANVVIKNAKGEVVKSVRVNANNEETTAYTVVSNASLKAYTIEITITELKWNGNPYTFKVAEVEMKATQQDPRITTHEHSYTEYIRDTQKPTCKESGKAEYACYCGLTSEKSTPITDHSYTVLVSSQAVTCTSDGKDVYKCEYCGKTIEETIKAQGHIYEKLVEYISEPTNAKNGEAIFKCINCDSTSNKTIQALPLGKVEHLRVESVDSRSVTLKFNVYGETANYEIRYSTSEITNNNFGSASIINATVTGDKEYTVVVNLTATLNKSYYVAIRPYIGNNRGEITTIRVGGNKLIPIDYSSGNVYSGEVLNSFAKLFDEQKNERTKIPTSVLSRIITDTKDTELYGMNLSPIVDLEYMHYVSSVYLYFANAGTSITVRWSDTPVDAYADNSKWDGYYTTSSTQGWNEFKINGTTRYIQIIFQDGSAPYEMLVYGYQNGDGDEIATEIGSLPTIGEMMGMCGFVANGGGNTPIDSVMCTTVLREYHNFGWSYSLTGYPYKASFFNTSWMCNFDSQYVSYRRAGINVIPCVQWDLVNIPQSNKVDENNLPIKSDGNFVKGDFWDKMNPHTYFMYADSMFAFSARYGSNNSSELLNTLALHASDTNKVGLNCLEWIEMGNEPEGGWNGIHNYYSAYQLAALTSAAYDGHCRTMTSSVIDSGYHLGVKNADPNMKAAMAGVSAVSNEYITAMCYWMKANRQDGKVAFDAFNVHCYMTKQITLPNGQTATVGQSPEEAGLVNTLSQLIAIRDKYYPEKEVWITEFGWDTNQSYATSTSSHAYANEETGVSYTGKQVQAMWLTRAYLLLSASGIDKATMYMCEDCGVEEISVGKYGTAGVIGYKYDEKGNTVEFKKDSYYYLYTLKNTLGDYTFNAEIEAYDENVMIYEYKTADGKTAYAVWCPTSDGTVSEGYQLKIDGSGATIVENENGNIYGVKTDVKADSLGYISVNVSENPIYILVD